MVAKVFKKPYKDDPWLTIISGMEFKGIGFAYKEPDECDHAIFLGGKWENPLCVKAKKKTLIYHLGEWGGMFDVWLKDILLEYYDDLIDVSELSVDQTLEVIKKCLNSPP